MILDIPIKKYEEANSCKKRDCYAQLEEYLNNSSTKVCALYGLRRTGKSTMIFQAMKEVGLENAGYILCEDGENYRDLCQVINEYKTQGKNFIFIDEITKLANFVTTSASLADYFSGSGVKIVITGTDSLGLYLAACGELYDRMVNIHTTYVSYGEFLRLIEKTDTDDFIRYAGVLSHEQDVTARDFHDRSTASRYIDSAISNNITNTFFNKRLPDSFIYRYDRLIGLHNRNTLVSTITAIVEMYSGVITKNTLDKFFKDKPYNNKDLSSALDMLEKKGILLDRETFGGYFSAQIALALNLRRDIKDEIEEAAVEQIRQYLIELDLLVRIPIIKYNSGNPQEEHSHETAEYIYQAGIKYCQAKEIMNTISESIELKIESADKRFLLKKIDQDVKGRILEITAFNDVQHFFDCDRYKIFKMQFIGEKAGEIDMIIQDKEEQSYYCFEIKHSDTINDDQVKNLLYEPYHKVLDKYFGMKKGAALLYRGETSPVLSNGIKYINIGEFLSEVYLYRNKALDKLFTANAAQEIENDIDDFER